MYVRLADLKHKLRRKVNMALQKNPKTLTYGTARRKSISLCSGVLRS